MGAWGQEDGDVQALEAVVELFHGLGPQALAVEEVAAEEDQVRLSLPGGLGETAQQLTLFGPPFHGLLRGEGQEGGVQVEIGCV